ncbi:MAG: hypothetical protein ACRC2R_09375 [Xenococcaceae cyanobacterium]
MVVLSILSALRDRHTSATYSISKRSGKLKSAIQVEHCHIRSSASCLYGDRLLVTNY